MTTDLIKKIVDSFGGWKKSYITLIIVLFVIYSANSQDNLDKQIPSRQPNHRKLAQPKLQSNYQETVNKLGPKTCFSHLGHKGYRVNCPRRTLNPGQMSAADI